MVVLNKLMVFPENLIILRIKIMTSQNMLFEEIFYFIEKSCSILEKFSFFNFSESREICEIFEIYNVMMSISTDGASVLV